MVPGMKCHILCDFRWYNKGVNKRVILREVKAPQNDTKTGTFGERRNL